MDSKKEKEIREKITAVVGEKNAETFLEMTENLLWCYDPEFLAKLYQSLVLDLSEQVTREKALRAFEDRLADIIQTYVSDTTDDEGFASFKNADWDQMARTIREDIDSFVRRAQLVGNCNSLLDEVEDLKGDDIFYWSIR
jgi:hypothetical protein